MTPAESDAPRVSDPEATRPAAMPADAVSQRIGPYKLLQKLGEGGYGIVYLAEQEEPVRRRVAIKVIKPGMDTREVIARFEAERQALAMMDHPNIARVFDAGATDAGRPYFAMELVRGVPITRFCDEHHLPTAARIGLFAEVCHAVQHAHQKGIIHRDLKPSNILVATNPNAGGAPRSFGAAPGSPLTGASSQGVPKVIDFGIAKATQGRLTDATLFTAFEQFIGTPAYMSPEQAEMSGLDVDTRSDVYSLGVLLYELLTGLPPFDSKTLLAAGIDAMRRQIREETAARPSARLATLGVEDLTVAAQQRQTAPKKLIASLRGDLDWVVMRCLEKDRSRRYATAAAVADDLQHLLRHEPVTARPPSTWYILGKLARRHRIATYAICATSAALIMGAVLTIVPAVKMLRAQRDRARQPVETALAIQNAEAALGLMRAEFEALLTADGTPLPRHFPHREGLDRIAARLGRSVDLTPPQRAALHGRLARGYLGLTDYAAARVQAEQALSFERQSDPRSVRTAEALGLLAQVLGFSGHLNECRSSIAQLLAMNPWVPANDLGWNDPTERVVGQLRRTKKPADAESLQKDGLEMRRRILGEDHPLTTEVMLKLAKDHRSAGRLREAEPLAARVVQLRRGFLGDEKKLLVALEELGEVYRALEMRREEASVIKELFETAGLDRWPHGRVNVDRAQELALRFCELGDRAMAGTILTLAAKTDDTSWGASHPKTLSRRIALAHIRNQAAEVEKLERLLLACNPFPSSPGHERAAGVAPAVPIRRSGNAAPETQFVDALAALLDLADFYRDAPLPAKEAEIRRAISAAMAGAPDLKPEVLETIRQFQRAYSRAGNWTAAAAYAGELLRLVKSAPTPNQYDVGFALSAVAWCRFRQGRLDEAIRVQREVVSHYRQHLGEWSVSTVLNTNRLATFLLENGQFDEADVTLAGLLDLVVAHDGSLHKHTDTVRRTLADLRRREKKFGEAAKLWAEIAAANERMFGSGHSRTLEARRMVGEVWRDQGRFAEAVALHRQVADDTLRALGPRRWDTFAAFGTLADDFVFQNNYAEAIAVYEQAVRAAPTLAPVWRNLAWLRATAPVDAVRNGRAALEAARKACELSAWHNAYNVATLAAAHAEAGEFDRAVEYQRQALTLGDFSRRDRQEAEERLALFSTRRPFRTQPHAVPSPAR